MVLIIIGLLSGGILLGRQLIHAAELRSVMGDIEKFNTAVYAFRGKYNCLPGDCAKATEFFGQDAGNCARGSVASGTCDGDGNGKIGEFCSTEPCNDLGNDYGKEGREKFLAWQQLALAELIAGRFSGTGDLRDSDNYGHDRASLVGWNVPASKISGAGYLISDMEVDEFAVDRFTAQGHYIFFGNPMTDYYAISPPSIGQLFEPSGPAISPVDAAGIDGKMDNGRPDSGSVMSVYNAANYLNNPLCVIAGAPGEFRYDAGEQIACALLFKANF